MTLLTTRERILPGNPQYAEPIDRNFGELWTVINGSISADNIIDNSITGGASGELALATITADNIANSTITLGKMASAAADQVAATASLRTLGTGAAQAAAGDHAHSVFTVAWTNLTLGTGWSARSTFETPQYCKLANGFVMLRGVVTGSATVGTPLLATGTPLPAGCRPGANAICPASGYSDGGSWAASPLTVGTGGTITVNAYADYNATGWFGLNGVVFYAEG